MKNNSRNIDTQVVDDFGREWSKFDQNNVSTSELGNIFNNYFSIFPWDKLPENAQGFDLGCGSGRWAQFVAPKIGQLHCIEPSSEAIQVSKKKLSKFNNCIFHQNGVDDLPLENNSMDFGYSLGVLHHIPDTAKGIKSCVQKLKPGAPLLLYLYYAFDNKPFWYRFLWKASNLARLIVCRLPYSIKYLISQILAVFIYFPLARLAHVANTLGINTGNFPLTGYSDKSFYTMRTDALDRFGTRLEQRFTKPEITEMMHAAGLQDIVFNKEIPYWCAVGFKSHPRQTLHH